MEDGQTIFALDCLRDYQGYEFVPLCQIKNLLLFFPSLKVRYAVQKSFCQ